MRIVVKRVLKKKQNIYLIQASNYQRLNWNQTRMRMHVSFFNAYIDFRRSPTSISECFLYSNSNCTVQSVSVKSSYYSS